eukprot:TRINITY_DN39890_c0_g1_i1.p1 TRINITY_DN39890_c0_g1~~TRINITY_DN39890_c0_g1_i1.p1  ORF type:complete len:770 (+),score=165.57 TRINITY_DN39890_c0_g1_i1:44-2311(+)
MAPLDDEAQVRIPPGWELLPRSHSPVFGRLHADHAVREERHHRRLQEEEERLHFSGPRRQPDYERLHALHVERAQRQEWLRQRREERAEEPTDNRAVDCKRLHELHEDYARRRDRLRSRIEEAERRDDQPARSADMQRLHALHADYARKIEELDRRRTEEEQSWNTVEKEEHGAQRKGVIGLHDLLYEDHRLRAERLQRRQEAEERAKLERERQLRGSTAQSAPRVVVEETARRLHEDAEKRRLKQEDRRQREEHVWELQQGLSKIGKFAKDPGDPPRWETLHAKASERELRLESERHRREEKERKQLEEMSVHRVGAFLEDEEEEMPRYERLYLDGLQRRERHEQKLQCQEVIEERCLQTISVHRRNSVASGTAEERAERLYADARDRELRFDERRRCQTEAEREHALLQSLVCKEVVKDRVGRLYKDAARRRETQRLNKVMKEEDEVERREAESVHAKAKHRNWSMRDIADVSDRMYRARSVTPPRPKREPAADADVVRTPRTSKETAVGGTIGRAPRFAHEQRRIATEARMMAKKMLPEPLDEVGLTTSEEVVGLKRDQGQSNESADGGVASLHQGAPARGGAATVGASSRRGPVAVTTSSGVAARSKTPTPRGSTPTASQRRRAATPPPQTSTVAARSTGGREVSVQQDSATAAVASSGSSSSATALVGATSAPASYAPSAVVGEDAKVTSANARDGRSPRMRGRSPRQHNAAGGGKSAPPPPNAELMLALVKQGAALSGCRPEQLSSVVP